LEKYATQKKGVRIYFFYLIIQSMQQQNRMKTMTTGTRIVLLAQLQDKKWFQKVGFWLIL
jgi:hypothetical protein